MWTEFLDLKAWGGWFASLDREFIFLLALPFVVAVVGLWSWWAEKDVFEREYEERAAQADERERKEREHKERERQRGARIPHHGLR